MHVLNYHIFVVLECSQIKHNMMLIDQHMHMFLRSHCPSLKPHLIFISFSKYCDCCLHFLHVFEYVCNVSNTD